MTDNLAKELAKVYYGDGGACASRLWDKVATHISQHYIPKSEVEQIIESVLLKRIKFIGDGEQVYTGNPKQLIEEITQALCSNKDGGKDANR